MSTTHIVHADVHDVGLVDGCPRCAEHAENPFLNLDNETLGNLVQRVVYEEDSRSQSERVAMVNVKRALDEACGLAKLNPDAFSQYAYGQWGIRVVVAV